MRRRAPPPPSGSRRSGGTGARPTAEEGFRAAGESSRDGPARPGYVNIGLTAEPCESVHPWTERGGAPSRVSVVG
ncbi:hypothetical protein C1875_13615 [Eggerthella lenta]|uniref:Uncharacterized protein n=1 Tax=Eggerthella lenta TaxID=84112 RepID=A0A369M5X7_EGGLN|nr:hypothetical protein C1875_13615 [Eggerthella lenta]